MVGHKNLITNTIGRKTPEKLCFLCCSKFSNVYDSILTITKMEVPRYSCKPRKPHTSQFYLSFIYSFTSCTSLPTVHLWKSEDYYWGWFSVHPMALGIEHQSLGQVLLSSEHLIYLNLDVKNYLTIIAWVGGEEKARKNFPSVKWWLLIRNGSP